MQLLPKFLKQPFRTLGNVPKYLKMAYLMRTSRINPAPIIILGNKKSGTTAIAKLLGKATGKTVTSDVVFRIREKNFKERLYSRTVSFHDFIRKNRFYFSSDIIKDPNFTFFYDEILECFPEKKFIFIVRDPRDNIRSILNRLSIPGNLEVLDNCYIRSISQKDWKWTIEGRMPSVLGNTYIEKLANRWNLAVDTYIKNKDNIVLIRYEDFCKDKVGAIAQLARKVELEPIYDISSQVDVQYQPRGNRNICWLDFFGADNLHRIENICKDKMKLFGYKLSKEQYDLQKF